MIDGVTAHPIAAKGVLVNPILVAADLIARFDPVDTPEHTEGREGYCWVNAMSANQAQATLKVSLRDFDDAGFARRKEELVAAVAATRAAFPRAVINCRVEDVYANIASSLGNDRRSVALLEAGFDALGIPPQVIALRGGTDGSAPVGARACRRRTTLPAASTSTPASRCCRCRPSSPPTA